MQKKAIIADLDNTIYPVISIGEKLFSSLFKLIDESKAYKGDFEKIKAEIMRRPFQFVANDFSFSEQLTEDCMALLNNLTYNDSIEPFADYKELQQLNCTKFLVTTGFAKLQNSKVQQLQIENDFEKIFIVDPSLSSLTKKDVFLKIINEYGYGTDEILVVGDDLHSEIKAGNELGITTVLYDHLNMHTGIVNQLIIYNFKDLQQYL